VAPNLLENTNVSTERGMRILNWVQVFFLFVHKRIISAVKRVESVSGRMSYLTLRGRWCHIIVVNVHAPTDDETDDVRGSFYEVLERVFDRLSEYQMNILLRDSSAEVSREDIFKPTIGSLNETSHDNGVRVANSATSKNLTAKSTMSPHRNSHKFTWTFPDGRSHSQIDHFLIDRRRHSSVVDARSFRAANCDTDHHLVVTKLRENSSSECEWLKSGC
jgi:hypothetical protein